MAAGCVELKGLNPKLNVTTQTSEADAYYIKYKNPLYEAQHLENVDSVYRAADSVYVHPERLMKQMFRDSVYVEKACGCRETDDGLVRTSWHQSK